MALPPTTGACPMTAPGTAPTLAELVALRPLALRAPAARAPAEGMTGPRAAAIQGRGMTYAESRLYAAGDEARHVDWRLTARTGRMQTKHYHPDRDRLTLLVADTAPALYFGTRAQFKSVQAARAGALLAWAACAAGDRLGAVAGPDATQRVQAAAGVPGALRVLKALCHWYAAAPEAGTMLPQALDVAARQLQSGARLLVLADAASVLAVPAMRWQALARRARICVLLLTDPLEQSPPAQAVRMAHGARAFTLDLDGAAARAAWHALHRAPLQTACQQLAACGIAVQGVSCALQAAALQADLAHWQARS